MRKKNIEVKGEKEVIEAILTPEDLIREQEVFAKYPLSKIERVEGPKEPYVLINLGKGSHIGLNETLVKRLHSLLTS